MTTERLNASYVLSSLSARRNTLLWILFSLLLFLLAFILLSQETWEVNQRHFIILPRLETSFSSEVFAEQDSYFSDIETITLEGEQEKEQEREQELELDAVEAQNNEVSFIGSEDFKQMSGCVDRFDEFQSLYLLEETEKKRDVHSFGDVFRQQCGWWMKAIRNWKVGVSDSYQTASVASQLADGKLYAQQERSGVGDRMAGIMGAFYFALQRKVRLEVRWTLINEVFQPSCLVDQYISASNISSADSETLSDDGVRASHVNSSSTFFSLLGDSPPKHSANACEHASYYSCSYKEHLSDHCHNYNRACMAKTMCNRLVRSTPLSTESITMTNVIGCPLRALLQPRSDFFDHEVSWFVDGSHQHGTLRTLVQLIKTSYLTIAIHIRMGDKYMHENHFKGDPDTNTELSILSRTEECVHVVEQYLAALYETTVLRGRQQPQSIKPVKWLIASDDVRIRNYFQERFPSKVILLSTKPHHVSSIKRDDASVKVQEVRDLFAEWYLIGQADELITNRAHRFGVSAFSRSARIYHLKSQYFGVEAKNPRIKYKGTSQICRRREFQYQGNSVTIGMPCKGDIKRRNISQPHLDYV